MVMAKNMMMWPTLSDLASRGLSHCRFPCRTPPPWKTGSAVRPWRCGQTEHHTGGGWFLSVLLFPSSCTTSPTLEQHHQPSSSGRRSISDLWRCSSTWPTECKGKLVQSTAQLIAGHWHNCIYSDNHHYRSHLHILLSYNKGVELKIKQY